MHTTQVVDKFSTIAAAYQQGQAQRLDIPLFRKLLQPQPHEQLLDIATGTGAVLLGLAHDVADEVGIDVCEPMLQQARAAFEARGLKPPTLLVGDAPQLAFADQSFDLVTCSRALHHMTDPQQALRHVARVLRPGGRLLILDNLTYDEPDFARAHNRIETIRDSSHARTLAFRELLALVARAGLELRAACEEEVLRPVAVWLNDAGTPAAETALLLDEIRTQTAAGDQFALQHFQRSAAGEWLFRYRLAWVVALRPAEGGPTLA